MYENNIEIWTLIELLPNGHYGGGWGKATGSVSVSEATAEKFLEGGQTFFQANIVKLTVCIPSQSYKSDSAQTWLILCFQ